MADTATNYVRYADGVETPVPEEERLIDETMASMGRVQRDEFNKHLHASRDAHPKSHAILSGELQVYDSLPAHLAQGLFKAAKTYPVIIRLSSAQTVIGSDEEPTFKGFAIKVIGVEGPKLLPDQADELTQDFLLVNHPTIAAGTITAYHALQLKLEKLLQAPQLVQEVVGKVTSLLDRSKAALGYDPGGPTHPENNLLGETFYSMGAFRYGDYVAKISAAPLSPSVRALTGQHVDVRDSTAWRELVADFFRVESAEYELRAQLCTDLQTMPVEDGAVGWPEAQSLPQPIGKLTIQRQDTYSPARRVFADDVLSYNPFHCLPEHQPLGSINRARRKVYEHSTAYRHTTNAQARREPRSIDELPA